MNCNTNLSDAYMQFVQQVFIAKIFFKPRYGYRLMQIIQVKSFHHCLAH